MIEATVTSKGQVTIPIKIRELLGLEEGSKLVFQQEEDKIIIKSKSKDPLKELLVVREKAESYGKLYSDKELKEIMKESKEKWSKFQ